MGILFEDTIIGIDWRRTVQARKSSLPSRSQKPLASHALTVLSSLYRQLSPRLDIDAQAADFGFLVPYFDLALIRFPTPP